MSVTAESRLAGLAVGQWGMLTAAQASAHGIARSTLARREKAGTLERVRQGVYRLPGTPADRLEDIRAAWLSSNPANVARDRVAAPDVVVGGAAAAWTHEIGDLYPAPYLLYTTQRRQTAHDDVRYSRRHLPASDVIILDGLPVTTRERTIADLLDEGDLSLVADALRDAELSTNNLDTPALIGHLDAHAKRLGHTSGTDLYAELRTLAGVDAARLQDLVVDTDLTERMGAEVGAQMQRILAPIVEEMNARIAATFPDALAPVRKQLDDQMQRIMAPAQKQLDDQMEQMMAPTMKALRGIQMPKLPRVKLPGSALPKITLPTATQAMLRELALRSAQLSALAPATPDSSSRDRPLDAKPSNEDDE